jgi:hypothetical protein
MASRGDTIRSAIALKSDEDVVERLREALPDSLDMLARIASGEPIRNAQFILKAIETQLRFSQPPPKTVIEHQGSVGFSVIDPYALPPVDAEVLEPAREQLALPRPKPPLVRKKGSGGEQPVLCGRCGQPTSETHECPCPNADRDGHCDCHPRSP